LPESDPRSGRLLAETGRVAPLQTGKDDKIEF
jgi:hypothetical protein